MRAPRALGCLAILSILAALSTTACGKPVDLTQGLKVDAVSTGWFDAGIVDAKNKLVPTIVFRLRNVSDQTLTTLQVNALFRRVTEKDEWGSGFLTAAGSSGLKPGASTDRLVIKSQLGYTGTESRQEMFQNRQFVDAKVDLFVKYGSVQWVKVGEYPIARQLIIP
jgi:hypothetical protein